jgi:hypothetical protein
VVQHDHKEHADHYADRFARGDGGNPNRRFAAATVGPEHPNRFAIARFASPG